MANGMKAASELTLIGKLSVTVLTLQMSPV